MKHKQVSEEIRKSVRTSTHEDALVCTRYLEEACEIAGASSHWWDGRQLFFLKVLNHNVGAKLRKVLLRHMLPFSPGWCDSLRLSLFTTFTRRRGICTSVDVDACISAHMSVRNNSIIIHSFLWQKTVCFLNNVTVHNRLCTCSLAAHKKIYVLFENYGKNKPHVLQDVASNQM